MSSLNNLLPLHLLWYNFNRHLPGVAPLPPHKTSVNRPVRSRAEDICGQGHSGWGGEGLGGYFEGAGGGRGRGRREDGRRKREGRGWEEVEEEEEKEEVRD